MNAAVGAAQAGYPVLLVEREPQLGGFMNKMNKRLRPPYKELKPVGLEEQIQKVEAEPNIKVFTSAQIEKISGGPGVYDVTISQNGALVNGTGRVRHSGHRLEALRCGQAGPSGLRKIRQRDHQRANGRDGQEA